MAASQNSWPVVGREQITDRAVLGVEFPNGWLKGDVDVVFTYLIGRLHREVEPMIDPGCWGWFVKDIEGSSTISNHASGTAIDYNAPKHPMGVRNTYSAGDRAKIRAILRDLDGVVRWGGDYSGRPDDMHFEIVKNAAAVKLVADRIKEDDGMPSVDDLLAADRIPNDVNPGTKGKPGYNPEMTVLWALRYAARAALALEEARAARKDIAVLRAQVAELAGKDFTDEGAIVAGVLAGLDPAAIAAAIPAELARQVADELAARLQG